MHPFILKFNIASRNQSLVFTSFRKQYMMKNLNKLWIFFVLLSMLSCNSDDDTSVSNCSNIGCTEEFVSIIVTIKDQNQAPVALTSYQVIQVENGEDITINLSNSAFQMAQQDGSYPVTADGIFEQNQEAEIQFRGFIDNEEVIRSNYMIATDCCHINLVSGDTTLILE